MAKHHFIYKITRFDGKFYVGRHSTTDLNDGYFGSGLMIKRSVQKHGRENHKIEILETSIDYETLCTRERDIVNESVLSDPMCMNLKLGGDGGWDHVNSDSAHQSNAGKKGGAIGGKIGGKISGPIEGPKSRAKYNARVTQEEINIRQRKVADSKIKNGTTNKNRICVYLGNEQRNVRECDLESFLLRGFKKGRKPRKNSQK